MEIWTQSERIRPDLHFLITLSAALRFAPNLRTMHTFKGQYEKRFSLHEIQYIVVVFLHNNTDVHQSSGH